MSMRIVIAGAGLAGSALALALKQGLGQACEIVVADPVYARRSQPVAQVPDNRAFAISAAGQRMFQALGVWDRMCAGAQPIREMVVTDSRTRDVVRPGYLTFTTSGSAGHQAEAKEMETVPFAHMVWSRVINQVLGEALRDAGVVMRPEAVLSAEAGNALACVTYASGEHQKASLVVAADGARSRLRERAGIGWITSDYRQSGIVATIRHQRDHQGRAFEHFLPAGPFAMLPLPPDAQGHFQSSIVWTEDTEDADALLAAHPDDFLEELENRFGLQLGALELVSGPKAYPLSFGIARRFVADRLALLGDAAHVIHPIAGQGLNLGLKDAAALAQSVVDAARLGLDVGSRAVLDPYQAARRFDTMAMGVVTDGLNRLFSNDLAPVRLARDLGLGLVDRMPGLKRFFIQEAAGRRDSGPRLLRGDAI